VTSFNLVNEPWIAVNRIDGKNDLVSLKTLFSESRSIRSIECDNPMQTAAVTRLVLAVMYRALTPLFESQKSHAKNADVTLWKMLWDDKTSALSRSVDSYLDEWESRFDLFDKKRPFFQIADLEYSSRNEGALADVKRSLGKIMPDGDLISVFRNSPFNAAVGYAEAARILITYHSWSTLAPLSPVIGIYPTDEDAVPRVYPKGHRGWCSSIGVTMLAGRDIYETLLLNFVPSQLKPKDSPFWEDRYAQKVRVLYEANEELGKPVLINRSAKPVGQVQLFAWFAKSVRLVESEGKVVGVVASENNSLSSRSSQVHMARHHETQTAWKETSKGEMAAYHFMGDSVWQNVPALIPKTREGFLAPLNVVWAAKIVNILGIQLPARIRIIGANTDDRAQTFRGVIDKSITIASLSRLHDSSTTAQIEDASARMSKMVRSSYFGFAKDSLLVRYGEASETHLEALMMPANNALDKAFNKLFKAATSEGSAEQVALVVTELANELVAISRSVAEESTASELLGIWRVVNGEKRVFSIAASRNRLLRTLAPYYQRADRDDEDGNLVRWAIKNNVTGRAANLPMSDVSKSVLDIWSKRKHLSDGRSTHINESTTYSSLAPMKRDAGFAFDERINALFEARDDSQLRESLWRIAGVINSKGLPVDFGTLANMGTALQDAECRVDIAEALVEKTTGFDRTRLVS